MIINKYNGLDVEVHYEKLDNGLEIFLIPFTNRKNYSVEYVVKFGSNICDFVSSTTNKRVKVPRGVAHFLEHKMFEQEDGVDPFTFFSKSGCDANAYTTYRYTSYTVAGSKNLEENLNFLIDYVNSPYFTDENVEKEKGIIIEELKMYKNSPESKIDDESVKAVFVKHPKKYDVGGTPSSVKKITKEILYDCYNTFYQPSNMFIVVSGNIDCNKVEEIIKNHKKLKSKKSGNPIKVYKVKEPILVNNHGKEMKVANLILSKSLLSIKSPLKELEPEDDSKYIISLKILLYLLFGSSSTFNEYIYNNKLVTSFFNSSYLLDNISMIEFYIESQYPDKVKDLIMDCLKNKKITEKDVERVKKVILSSEVMDTDSIFVTSKGVIRNNISYGKILYNKIDIIRSITLKDIQEVRKDLMLDNYSFIIGNPK